MGPEEGMASAMDSEESIDDQLAKLQEEIDFKRRKLADLKAENARKAQELREKKRMLAAMKHFKHKNGISVTDFIHMILKIAAIEEAVKTMTDTVNKVIKTYKGKMMKQAEDEYLNTVVLVDVLRDMGKEIEEDDTTKFADFLRKNMPVEHGKNDEWEKRVEESRKMWHDHLDEWENGVGESREMWHKHLDEFPLD